MICIVACLILVVGIGSFLTDWMVGIPSSEISGTVILVGNHAALGYILMGLMAFLLGVFVTVLLYRLRRRNERKQRENRNNGL